ncbi:MAG TPA: hypothetical protein VHS97_02810, partial [Isosphaeraceae bacterium]|nr:hypothetical protein [Isosphaeraceae bacterium]
MRRWRFIRFMTLGLVLLALPARLPAQDTAKTDVAPAQAPGVTAQPDATEAASTTEKAFHYFGFTTDPAYGIWEKISL